MRQCAPIDRGYWPITDFKGKHGVRQRNPNEFRAFKFNEHPMSGLRNVAIIAHVDHGKTTLVDKIIHHCNVIDPRKRPVT